MKHSIHILYIGLLITSALCIMGCTESRDELKSGDLLFEVAGDGGADRAIDAATSPEYGESFSHVGIVEVCSDGIFVIDASSRHGVSRRPLHEFLEESAKGIDGRAAVRAMRLNEPFDAEKAVNAAKSHIGEPYDSFYLPDNGRMYCSELVYESFRDKKGNRIFESRPMNFRSADGTYPEYWVKLFDSLGMDIPQGVPGTNPNDMSRSSRLQPLGWAPEQPVRR